MPQSFQAEECRGISTKRVHLEKLWTTMRKHNWSVEEDLKDVSIIAHIYQLRRRLPSEGSVFFRFGGERSVSFSLKLRYIAPWKLVLGRRSGFLLGTCKMWKGAGQASTCLPDVGCAGACFFLERKKPGIVRSRNLPLWYVICFLVPFERRSHRLRFFGKKLSDWKDLRSEIYCQVEFATILFLGQPKKKSEIIV